MRDPDGVVGRRLLVVFCLVFVLIVLDVVVRAVHRSARPIPSRMQLATVRRERWTLRRGAIVGSALVSFYVTYLAYRNLKSLIPVLRPGDLFDTQLAEFDRTLFGGNDPAELMHQLVGTGAATHVLSTVYVLFLLFVPVSLALALVFSRDLQRGLFYATAISINWALGAVSYFLLPSLGPVYAAPGAFADLPVTAATKLQGVLLEARVEYLRDPSTTDAAQSIAAFASLHTSVLFTAAVAAWLLGLGRPLQIALWTGLALTVASTIHLGWHYLVDDFGGVVVGLAALAIALAITGFQPQVAPPVRSARARVGTA
ncbi:hypothetical protein BH20ACT19_BH20ACT19_08920 [soil metagenome]